MKDVPHAPAAVPDDSIRVDFSRGDYRPEAQSVRGERSAGRKVGDPHEPVAVLDDSIPADLSPADC